MEYICTQGPTEAFLILLVSGRKQFRRVFIRKLLFADDAALVAHSEEGLQRQIDCFAGACKEFGLTVSLDKTKILSQEVSRIPNIKIGDHLLAVVEEFTYLGSTIASNLSLDCELGRRIGKAATLMSRLTKRVWDNPVLSVNTKRKVYRARVLGTLLYGSESWTPYSRQEQRLNVFHMRNLRRILHITWQDRISNKSVLKRAGLPSMFALLAQRCLR